MHGRAETDPGPEAKLSCQVTESCQSGVRIEMIKAGGVRLEARRVPFNTEKRPILWGYVCVERIRRVRWLFREDPHDNQGSLGL